MVIRTTAMQNIHHVHEYLVDRWKSLLLLGRDISLDEALLLWKGRLSWKQFICTKRARLGLKSFVLADAKTGYVWNSIIYTGSDTDLSVVGFSYSSTNIVMSLAEELLDEVRCIYVDNWYSSMELLDALGHRDRKGVPKDVMNAM